MAARLTDKEKKKIIADYVQIGSYNAVAKINGVAANTVKNIVKSEGAEFAERCTQKKEENTADILKYMESQKQTICEIIGKGLMALNDPEKLATANPSQITTALGTLIDKWTMVSGSSTAEQTESHNALIDAIRKRNNED
jgi:transposase-like protein